MGVYEIAEFESVVRFSLGLFFWQNIDYNKLIKNLGFCAIARREIIVEKNRLQI